MNRDESRAFLRSDEDDPDYLRDKPMGRCPWCGKPIFPPVDAWAPTWHQLPRGINCLWREEDGKLDNRARYQEERMAAAKIEEKSP